MIVLHLTRARRVLITAFLQPVLSLPQHLQARAVVCLARRARTRSEMMSTLSTQTNSSADYSS